MSTHVSELARIRRFRDTDQSEPLELRSFPLVSELHAAIVRVDPKARAARLRFAPSGLFVLPRGAIQGGVVATMLDMSMSMITTMMIPESKSSVTASLNVNYLKPAPVTTFTCEAHIERLGRTLAFLSAVLMPQDGEPVASAKAVFSIFDAPAHRSAG